MAAIGPSSCPLQLYHVIPGPPAPVTSLNDDQIFVTKQGETIQVGAARTRFPCAAPC